MREANAEEPATRGCALTLAAIVAVAFVLRIGWVAWADFQPTIKDDAGRYDFLARSLVSGGGYVNPNGATTMFWPPGYPFVLTAVYWLAPAPPEGTAARVLNAVCGAASVALV
jgi:hypothetical protein